MDHVSRLISASLLALVSFGAVAATCDDDPVIGEGFVWRSMQSWANPTHCQNMSGPEAVLACSEPRYLAIYGADYSITYSGPMSCTASDTYGCRAYGRAGSLYWNFEGNQYYQGAVSITANRPVDVAPNESLCTDPEPECGDGTKGRLQPTRAASATQVTTIIGSCLDGCAVSGVRVDPVGINKEPDGTFYFLPFVKFSGEACAGGEPEIPPADPTPVDEPSGEICKESAAGTDVCTASAYGENCGYVNGNFVCLGKTDADECWVNPDGSRLCGDTAPTPPVPDNGTPGVKAAPTDQVSAVAPSGSGTTYNYYNSATVAGSSRDPGDSGANPNRPSSADPRTEPTPVTGSGGDGTGIDIEFPSGEASGGETCDAAPTCTHDDPVQCAMLNQQWRTRCVDAIAAEDSLAAIGATEAEQEGDLTGGADPIEITSLNADGGFSGSCPAPISVTVMGQTLSLDIWLRACEMAVLFAPVVMMMGYLIAIGIIVKGVKA
jgi:hypothetical protein